MAEKFNYYETLYLVRPDVESGDLSAIQGKLAAAVAEHKGETIRNEKWSDRDLAYEIRGYRRGTYHILTYRALPGVAAAVEKHMGLHKSEVMRFITVSVDEDQAHGREPVKPPAPPGGEAKPENGERRRGGGEKPRDSGGGPRKRENRESGESRGNKEGKGGGENRENKSRGGGD